MSELLTIKQIKDSENRYIKKNSFNKLINNASQKIYEFIKNNFKNKKILFICGPGNNGVDGKLTYELLNKRKFIYVLDKNKDLKLENLQNEINKADIIFDCIFGIGLNKKVEGKFRLAIELINKSKRNVVSVDIPSGINSDSGRLMGVSVDADMTLAMGSLKPGYFLLPGKEKIGKLVFLDLSLLNLAKRDPDIKLIEKTYLKEIIPKLSLGINKYDKGHVLVLGGEMSGASRLVAYAARKSGCGLSTILVDKKNLKYYSTCEPGTIVKQFKNDYLFKENILVLGPGLGKEFSRQKIKNLIRSFLGYIVIDADAISIFENHKKDFYDLLKARKNIVITPHEGEFKRVFKIVNQSKIISSLKASKMIKNCVLFKGNDTVIAFPSSKIWINSSSDNGLATAGSGDILCGIIAGLLAQKVNFEKAIIASVWIQNEISKSKTNVVVEDFLKAIPEVINALKNNN